MAAQQARKCRRVSFAHSPRLMQTALLNTRYGNRVSLQSENSVVWCTKLAAVSLLMNSHFYFCVFFSMTQAALVASLVKAYGLLDKMTYVSLCIKL